MWRFSGAQLTVSEINEILLVGGATRTPLVQRRLEEELGMQPRAEVDPDLCVAMGAAIQAAVIAGAQAPTVLVDVTPYTFGTSCHGYFNGEMYPYCLRALDPQEHADSRLAERGLRHTLSTARPGSTSTSTRARIPMR
jgi:molecular chaperone DnaK (HSP70)